eukprot:TRINITY_DN16584_c0_g1_i1.p1 TRINITY_DN16584_c0_g1~~TRINITY_DN16584_c0_g1_i1.p1  ORF type:complete len:663 (+),score=127.77 TRINITY_DN16584_c0_g1_i1:77-2065(+)
MEFSDFESVRKSLHVRLGLSKNARRNEAEIDFKDARLQRDLIKKTESSYEDKITAFERKSQLSHMQTLTANNWWRLAANDILDGVFYQTFIGLVTLLSCITVVLETDYRVSHDSIDDTWFAVFGDVILVVYAFDFGLQLFVLRKHFLQNAVSVVDALILFVDVLLSIWSGMPNVFAALKAVRFVRLARVLRTVAEFRELYLILQGIVSSIRALVFGSMLILIMLTLFSILAVHFIRPVHLEMFALGVYGDCAVCEEAFDSVMQANLTFMATVVAGDGWGRIAIPLCTRSPIAAILLIGNFIVINLGLLNTIAAVIVDRQAQARQEDIDYMLMLRDDEVKESYSRLKDLFKAIDRDGNGSTELEELMDFYDTDEEFKKIMNRMDIHKSDLPIVFDIIDSDQSGDVEFNEFVSGLHSLKHENSHTLQVFTKHFAERLYEKWVDVEEVKAIVLNMQRSVERMVRQGQGDKKADNRGPTKHATFNLRHSRDSDNPVRRSRKIRNEERNSLRSVGATSSKASRVSTFSEYSMFGGSSDNLELTGCSDDEDEKTNGDGGSEKSSNNSVDKLSGYSGGDFQASDMSLRPVDENDVAAGQDQPGYEDPPTLKLVQSENLKALDIIPRPEGRGSTENRSAPQGDFDALAANDDNTDEASAEGDKSVTLNKL